MRPLVGIVAAAAALAAAAGVAAWARWLARRRRIWFTRLNDAIPTHAAYWRERARREGDLLYLAIGDSAAQGIGASRPGKGYVGQLAQYVAERTRRRWRVVNVGVSGATVALAVRDQLPRIRRLRPALCTVAIGANDIAAFDPEAFAAGLRALVDALPDHAIVADVPSFYFPPRERRVVQANRILRAVAAERGLPVVPLHARTRRQGAWGIVTQFAGDLFHPNDRGYRVWAHAFRPAVDARLRDLGLLP